MASMGVRHIQRETARKQPKKGVTFNLMIVGRSGLGKSTFLRTLVEREFFKPHDYNGDVTIQKTVEVIPVTQEIEDLLGQKVTLTLIDTPGFGDSIDNTDNFKPIDEYINNQYQRFLDEESRISRNPRFLDTRVHAILYMITPSGHSLKELDIQFMKELGRRVNVIPCIAKADTLSASELAQFKRRIMEDISHYDIPIYLFPAHSDEEPDFVKESEALRGILPFAVIGSDQIYDVGGRQVHGRKYPWGIVEVENEEHCDFIKLQDVLFGSHMHVLKEVTNDLHYENFRADNLSKSGVLDSTKIEQELQAREKAEKERRAALEQQRKKDSALQANSRDSIESLTNSPLPDDNDESTEDKPKKKKTSKKSESSFDETPKKKKKEKSASMDSSAQDDSVTASV